MNDEKGITRFRIRVGYCLTVVAGGLLVAIGGIFRQEITWFLLEP